MPSPSIPQAGPTPATPTPPRVNWKAAISLDGGATYGAIVDPGANLSPAGSVSLPITATGAQLLLSGSLTGLNVFNVIAGSANFALSESTVSPMVGGTTLANATLLTVGLSNLQASAGAGGFGVAITGGDLGIAVLRAPADSRAWIAVTGSGLAGSLTLGSSVSASVSGLSVAINSASGADLGGIKATPLNWATTFSPAIDPGANIPPAGSVSLPITATGAQLLLSGMLTGLNVFNVIAGSASFALSQTTAAISPTGAAPATVTGATLLTLALSNLQATAGAGGFGLSITGGDLGIAVIEAPKPTTGSDSRYWIAVTGSGLAGSLTLGGAVSATVGNLSVAINQAGGKDANGVASSALDWTKDVSLDGGTTFAATVDPGANLPSPPSPSLAITSTAAGFSLGGSLTSLNVFNVIGGTANFALSESTVAVSFTGASPVNVAGATLLTVALSNLQATAGNGSFGVSITGGDLGIAVIEAPKPATGTDSRYWLAVVGNGLAGSLSLGTGVSATVSGLAVVINQAGGAGSNGLGSPALDWTKDVSLDGGTTFNAKVDPGANLPSPPSPSLAITSTAAGLSLSGSLTALNIFNIITGSANFALTESTVSVQIGNTKLSNAPLLTLALSNLMVSAGSGSFGVAFSAGDLGLAFLKAPAPASGADNRYWVAVDGVNLAASLKLGANITATVKAITASINQAGGGLTSGGTTTPTGPLNWSTSLDLNGDGVFGGPGDMVDPGVLLSTKTSPLTMPISFTNKLLALSGSLTSLNIYNLINGSANFALSQTTVNANVGGTVLTGATLLTVGLSDLQSSAGAGAFGVSVTSGDLGIAVLEAPGTDSRYWLAVVGSNLAASLNLSSLVTATVSSITIQINQAGGMDASSHPAVPLDWTKSLDLNGDGVYGGYGDTVDPGATLPSPVSMPIPFTTGPLLVLSGALTNLNLDNQINGSANFAIASTTVDVTGAATLTNAPMVTVALTNLVASGLGLQVSGGDIGIAVIEPPSPVAGDTRYWVAVTGMNLTATLNLGSAITLTSGSTDLEINQAGGALAGTSATALDWTNDISVDGGTTYKAPVNPGANLTPSVDLTIAYTMAVSTINSSQGNNGSPDQSR